MCIKVDITVVLLLMDNSVTITFTKRGTVPCLPTN